MPAWRVKYSWQTFKQLPPYQRHWFTTAAVRHWQTWIGIRLFGFNGWLTRISRGLSSSNMHGSELLESETIHQIANIIDKACRYSSIRSTCLTRSITLWWILRQESIPVELRIGVRNRDEIFEAHAWVELYNQVINDESRVKNEYTLFEGSFLPTNAEIH